MIVNAFEGGNKCCCIVHYLYCVIDYACRHLSDLAVQAISSSGCQPTEHIRYKIPRCGGGESTFWDYNLKLAFYITMSYADQHEASSSKPPSIAKTYTYDEQDESSFAELPEPLVLSPSDLLANYETINVLAPLVRCSKLPFRHLASLYETHITHTPMILAEEFSRSQTARISDFSTSVNERGVFWVEPRKSPLGQSSSTTPHRSYQSSKPHNRLPPTAQPPTKDSQLVRGLLLAQFASPNPASLADAAELIAPYIDGLDINCGCPQKWAFHEGIGCALLRKPELVADMIKVTKDRMGWGWPVSIKIRIDPEEQYVILLTAI
jgi:hypothetical protein